MTVAGYFRVPLETARVVAKETADPDALAAWLILRRFAYGSRRELTACGAKKIAGAIGITRPRAGRLLSDLLAIRWGERGEHAAIMTAADWNAETGHKVPPARGNAPVYVMPEPAGECAYLPDLLIPPGDGVRSYLADLCGMDAELGLDALRLLIVAHAEVSCGDYLGADPTTFACIDWELSGEHETDNASITLGKLGTTGGLHYWAAKECADAETTWSAVEHLTGGRTEAHSERFWRALKAITQAGLLCRVAIVSDHRGRLLYPLWVYGESHRERFAKLGIAGDLARRFQRQANHAGLEDIDYLVFSGDTDGGTGLFVCVTKSAEAPIIRTVYCPTLLAPTPDNMAGMAAVAKACSRWA